MTALRRRGAWGYGGSAEIRDAQRGRGMATMRREGATWEEIAGEYGVTPERAQQLAQRFQQEVAGHA